MSLFSSILLAVAVLLLVAYVFHNKIIRVAAFFTHLAFLSGFVGLLSILFFSSFYDEQIDEYLSSRSIGIQLHEADSTINNINKSASKAQSLWHSISGEKTEAKASNDSDLYGSFLSFMSISLQIIIRLVSLALMLFAVYFKYSFLGYMNVSRNEKRIRKIEERFGKS